MKPVTFFLLVLTSVFAENANFQEFTRANNLFTPTVYHEIALKRQENFLVSPLSVETLLTLTQAGCKGPTAEELSRVLQLPNNRFGLILKEVFLKLVGNEYALQKANKIYIKNSLVVKEDFRKSAVEVYGSEIEEINFLKSEEAANKINTWVREKTANKIQNLVDASQLNDKTNAILISVLYFKGKWAVAFPPTITKKADFYKTPSEIVQINTMYLDEEELLYFECPHLDAKFLELAFKGEEASMTIILPNKKDGLKNLESNIESVFVPHNLTIETVTVALPKFRIDSKFDLKKILKNLGVKQIFDKNQADLSGIAGAKGDLVVSKVVHETFVDVDEQGVEAAAATYIPAIAPEMGSTVEPKIFIADHPFIFYIKVKGLILFAGRFTAPK